MHNLIQPLTSKYFQVSSLNHSYSWSASGKSYIRTPSSCPLSQKAVYGCDFVEVQKHWLGVLEGPYLAHSFNDTATTDNY